MNKIKKLQIFRIITQLFMFFLLPGLYIMTFSELKEVIKMVLSGNINFTGAFPGLIEFIAVMLFTILIGRFFCGWFCAFGTYNDLIYLVSKKIFRTSFKIDEKTDSVLKYVKYAILLILLIVSCFFGSSILSNASPWDAFAQITDISNVLTTLTVGFILLALITIGSFFVERFFCRYLCPLGAVFTLVSKINIIKIRKPSVKCGNCRICTDNCSMGLKLYKSDNIRGGGCINCLKCIEACPRKNTCLNAFGEDINPALASSVALAAFVGIYGVGSLGGNLIRQIYPDSYNTVVSNTLNSSSQKYKDGTYTGTGTGFRGATTEVSVTISGGKITAIKTISTGDTPRFYYRVEQTMVDSIISSQSTSVDTVSGATYSCIGIIDAVKDALNKAV